jgi:2-oxoisovalerate dehydrogenase E1 component alpha subunit
VMTEAALSQSHTGSDAGGRAPDQHPSLVQVITPAGKRVTDSGYERWLDDIDDDAVRRLLRDMTLVRRFDREAVALQRQGHLGVWTSSLGQEAAQVGSARALGGEDYAFPTYRDHGVSISRGIDPVSILALFRGTTLGGWDPKATRTALYGLVLGTQVLHAVGYAMGMQRDGAADAVVAYFGDGATSQGDVNEAFVWAASFDAPVVFFCQNNQWAISTPASRQARIPLFRRAAGFGFPGIRVDGNDVLACLAVTRAALDRARTGSGPTLIEAFTYRVAAHSTSDDAQRYQNANDTEAWTGRDPLTRVEAYLRERGALPEGFLDDLKSEAEGVAKRVRRECLALADPDPVSMFDHVYTDPHEPLRRERDWFGTRDNSAPLDDLADTAPATAGLSGPGVAEAFSPPSNGRQP